VTTKTWGPDNVIDGIDWWADRLRTIEVGVSGEEDGTRYAVPAERFSVVVLDDLIAGDRDARYGELLAFLGIEDAPEMRSFFDAEMSPQNAHLGRWRDGIGKVGAARVRRKYERTLEALEREGNHVASPLRAAFERTG
jgi:hypothetical protein